MTHVRVGMLGGIGNQLFQYYAGCYLSKITESPLFLDISRLKFIGTQHSGNLSEILLPIDFKEVSKSNTLMQSFTWRAHQKLAREFPTVSRISTDLFHIYQSNQVGFDEKLEFLKSPIEVRGYFQTYKYFDFISNLNIPQPILRIENDWFSQHTSSFDVENDLVLHFRRGDYIGLSDTFGLLNVDYYERALAKLESLEKFNKVLVFSDDINLAKSSLNNLSYNFEYILDEDKSHTIDSLFLMSQFKKIIIANSSYSWWAAKLGTKDKVVVAPSKWFKNMDDPKDLLPANWVRSISIWN